MTFALCFIVLFLLIMSVCMSVCVCVWAMLPDSNKMMMNDNNRSVFQQNKSLYGYNDKRAESALCEDNCIAVHVAQGRAQNDI